MGGSFRLNGEGGEKQGEKKKVGRTIMFKGNRNTKKVVTRVRKEDTPTHGNLDKRGIRQGKKMFLRENQREPGNRGSSVSKTLLKNKSNVRHQKKKKFFCK